MRYRVWILRPGDRVKVRVSGGWGYLRGTVTEARRVDVIVRLTDSQVPNGRDVGFWRWQVSKDRGEKGWLETETSMESVRAGT